MALGLEQKIAEILNDAGLGDLYDGVTPKIFIGIEPETPDSIITVYPDSGDVPTLNLAETHTITIQVRDPSYETCMDTARDVYEALNEFQGNFPGFPIARVQAQFPPVRLGRDNDGRQGRYRSTQSFTVLTRRITFQ